MDLKKYKSVGLVLIFSLVFYGIHKLAVSGFDLQEAYSNFYHSLEILYLFFGLSSAVIMILLSLVKEKNFDNVGMTFLLITSIKMVFSYLMLRPVLNVQNSSAAIEKSNFFFLFILFLTIETLITIRILNNKQ